MIVDVVVIGSGIVGCASAYYLARAGLTVVVLDRTRLGGEASMAAAGMLAPYCEYDHRDPPEFMPFCVRGKAEYDWLVPTLRDDVGAEIDVRHTGFIYLKLAYQEEKAERKYAALRERGVPVEWLTAADVLKEEPHLAPDVVAGGILSEHEAVVDTLRVVEALRMAAMAQGARMIAQADVVDARVSSRGAVTIRTATDTFSAGHVLIAAGWRARTVGHLFGVDLPVIPVRGQMAALHGPMQLFRRVIYLPEGGCGSIIARPSGRTIVGTTEEYENDGSDVTLAGLSSFARRIVRVAPMMAQWPVLRTWSGLRPCGPDRMPLIGRCHELPQVLVATGHYRNGILLGPLTGRIVKELVLDESLSTPIDAFEPCRAHAPHEVYHDQL